MGDYRKMTFNVVGIYFFTEISERDFDPESTTLRHLLERFEGRGLQHSQAGDELKLSYRYRRGQSRRPTFVARPDIPEITRSTAAMLRKRERGDIEFQWDLEIAGILEDGEVPDYHPRGTINLDTPIVNLTYNRDIQEAIRAKSFRIVFRSIYLPHSTDLSSEEASVFSGLRPPESGARVVIDGFPKLGVFDSDTARLLYNRPISGVLDHLKERWRQRNFDWESSGGRIKSISLDDEKIESGTHHGTGSYIIWQYYRTVVLLEPRPRPTPIRLYTPPRRLG